jgi:hypothetical protein
MILDISKYNDVRKNITTHTRGEDTVPSCFLYGFYGKHRHACMLSNERLLRGRWDQGRRSRGLRLCRRHGEPPGASCERGRAQAACTAGGLARARRDSASALPWPLRPPRPSRWEALAQAMAAGAACPHHQTAAPRPPTSLGGRVGAARRRGREPLVRARAAKAAGAGHRARLATMAAAPGRAARRRAGAGGRARLAEAGAGGRARRGPPTGEPGLGAALVAGGRVRLAAAPGQTARR